VVRKKDRKTWWKLAVILTFVFALVIALAKSHQRRWTAFLHGGGWP